MLIYYLTEMHILGKLISEIPKVINNRYSIKLLPFLDKTYKVNSFNIINRRFISLKNNSTASTK